MKLGRPTNAVLLTGLVLLMPAAHSEQSSADTILEQARARSREIEELKKVLNGPDQNMRMATFDAMVNSQDAVMRAVAMDIGLASADSLLQALAFKTAILGLDRIHITLSVDTQAAKSVQEESAKYILSKGAEFVVDRIREQDLLAGTAQFGSSGALQVRGTMVTFKIGSSSGELKLQDDNSLRGVVHPGWGKPVQFIGTARIR